MRLLSTVLFLSGSLFVLSPSSDIRFYASAAETELAKDGDEDFEGGPFGESNVKVGDADKDDDALNDGGHKTEHKPSSPSGLSSYNPFDEPDDEVAPTVTDGSHALHTETSDGGKMKDWNKWMKQAKKDFSGYKGTMDTQRYEWTKEKEDELQKFCKYLEKRWMSYTGNIDRDCKSDFLQSTQSWNDNQWNKWVKSEGKHHMNRQFQKWLDYNKYKLQDWTNTEWNKWKANVKEQLDDEEWKKKEAAGKTKEWIKCTDKMEKKCLKKTKKHCKDWEKKANSSFKKWEGDFTKKWTSNKQWNTWSNFYENYEGSIFYTLFNSKKCFLCHNIQDYMLVRKINKKIIILYYLKMKGLYKILCLSGSLYILSSSYLSSGVSASTADLNEKSFLRPNIPGSLQELYEEGVTSISEWKVKKWSDFMKSLEEDFKEFLVYLKNEKNSWLEKKGAMWEQWKTQMEKKWEQYDELTFNELLSDDAESALKWNDNEWTDWFSNKGKLALTEEWEKWVEEQYLFYKEGISNDWTNWSEFKNSEFSTIQWKCNENHYWKYWEKNAHPDLPLYDIKNNMMEVWKNRVKKEKEEWSNWINDKQTNYIDVEWDKWEEWKNQNSKDFNEWMENFVKKMIENKQWRNMESSTYSENDVPGGNTSILEEKKEEDKSSRVKGNGLPRALFTFLVFLTSTPALLNTCSASSLIEKNDAVDKPVCLVGLVEGGLQKEEEWERCTWDNWKIKLEEDFNQFYFLLDKEKKEWLDGREEEWEKLIQEMENKWTTHEQGFDKSAHLSDIPEESSTWDDIQWEQWIRKKGGQLMEIEWKEWVNKNDAFLNEMIMKKWIQWKNSKLKSRVTGECKTDEDCYWADWEKNKSYKSLPITERTKWLKWKERNSRESDEWTNWVNIKECVYIHNEWNKWTEWKNNKRRLFKIWKDLFIDKWPRKMESSHGVDSIINKKSSFSTLKLDKSDILFCVNISFLKFSAQCVFFIYSLYIILKHFFPTVFKKLNNTLDRNTLNSIKYKQGYYVDKLKEKGNTELKDEEEDVFEDASEDLYTNEKKIETGGYRTLVEEATNSDKVKEDEKGKDNNQIEESEPNVANINTNYNIEKNADVNSEVKEPCNISTVEGKNLNKNENSDNNSKEGEKYNLMPENNDTVVNLGGTYFLEKRGMHIFDIKEEDKGFSNNPKDDKGLTEAKGNIDNKGAYSMKVKNITSNVEKVTEEGTSKTQDEGEKRVDEKEPSNYQIKKEGQVNESTGKSYSFKRDASSYKYKRKFSSVSLGSVQERNEREMNNYKLKGGEENIKYNSTNSLSKLGQKNEQKTVPNNGKMELGTRKVKKEILKEKREDEAKKDETMKDETMKDTAMKGAKKSNLKEDAKKEPKKGTDKLKDIRKATSLDTIYKSDLGGKDDEMEDDKSDEWKDNEWNNWIVKTEEDWKLFNKSVENKKNRWLEKNDKELEVWLKNMEESWMHYKENEENEYKSEAMKNSSTWNDSQWKQWIRTEGKKGMEADLKKWLKDKEIFLDGWISKEWIQWKNERMLQWLSVDWRHKEDETFQHYKSSTSTNVLHMKKKKKWMKWKERKNKEKEEWNNWVKGKEHLYVNNKWDKWSKWKRDKRVLYSQKFVTFINKWISNKQWTVWIQDQKDSTLKKK
ncbi:Tryptophan-rich antigen (Pv-fam-a) [Plasmodium coatneyi]|uniref:Tryptophan-rich antigen (Pv-fam-a) n=1 Tax=Plasmodium coatneyi TaxID=208452 RepID=A0A1B1DV16_9APIC|nr:Tryptophan-rich antigen (Pv-fam-a) [Plasmodium coatneyi]ANQ06425.1 Tryptophan-rich antigen (Pv-fam-a) [Plasmodium coatneyi]